MPYINHGVSLGEWSVSPDVEAAQRRLLMLRKTISQQPHKTDESDSFQGEKGAVSIQKAFESLPSHLGWRSASLRSVIPCPPAREMQEVEGFKLPAGQKQTNQTQTKDQKAEAVSIFPDIALAFLRERLVSSGRVWMLLRFLDSGGRGWFKVDEVKALLTYKHSLYRVCGWRQMRNLLNQGDSIFWRRNNGRIWLNSLPKVALSLNVHRFQTDSVLLPLKILLAKIGTLRAHLFATFHSGRAGSNPSDEDASPIARATIEAITHVSPRIQRLYERSARVSHQTHYCVGAQFSDEQLKEAAWQHGSAVFKLKDVQGKHGEPGREYVAWQLPNSYAGPHKRLHKNQRKRMNKRLIDLCHKGNVGNDQFKEVRYGGLSSNKRYFENGRFAVKARNRDADKKIYLSNKKVKGFWHELSL